MLAWYSVRALSPEKFVEGFGFAPRANSPEKIWRGAAAAPAAASTKFVPLQTAEGRPVAAMVGARGVEDDDALDKSSNAH